MSTADVPREKLIQAIDCLEGLLDNVMRNPPALAALTEAIVVLKQMLVPALSDDFRPRDVTIRRDEP